MRLTALAEVVEVPATLPAAKAKAFPSFDFSGATELLAVSLTLIDKAWSRQPLCP